MLSLLLSTLTWKVYCWSILNAQILLLLWMCKFCCCFDWANFAAAMIVPILLLLWKCNVWCMFCSAYGMISGYCCHVDCFRTPWNFVYVYLGERHCWATWPTLLFSRWRPPSTVAPLAQQDNHLHFCNDNPGWLRPRLDFSKEWCFDSDVFIDFVVTFFKWNILTSISEV